MLRLTFFPHGGHPCIATSSSSCHCILVFISHLSVGPVLCSYSQNFPHVFETVSQTSNNCMFPCQMLNLLINKGAHVNAMDKKDRKPIHWAAFMGECELSFDLSFITEVSG